jgi:two-component system CAI-1 autoinducer sensor kinase/phosphatase CqsS
LDKLAPGTWLSFRAAIMNVRERYVWQPLEPILHPSPWRLRLLGAGLLVGQPLFWLVWAQWLVQPYENLWLRAILGGLGLVLMHPMISTFPLSKPAQRIAVVVIWLELPVFFGWMFLCNSGNTVWLASVGSMILIYYHLTDWRIATVGTVTGALICGVIFWVIGPDVSVQPAHQIAVSMVVLAFSWSTALLLGISSANLRREHLAHTLATIGIMAHELRTPLSTAGLISDALQMQSEVAGGGEVAEKMARLADRLRTITRNMNHQIDTQISNARLMQLPGDGDLIVASELVRQVIRDYPYRSSRERQCVELTVYRDFRFRSSQAQFSQVLDNLIKNALHSLQTASSALPVGDLLIEVGASGSKGRIVVIDRGMGINPESLPHIFEAFFSTNRGTGHGLGLAFCKRVVQTAKGSLSVKSVPLQGATFTIELPVQA